MTLLCELTDIYALINYFDALNKETEKQVPTIFGHQLYKFLYKYLSQNSNKINFIEIIKPDDIKIQELFTQVLKNYSPELIDYKSVWAIAEWFPEENLLRDKFLKDKITNIIQNIRFVKADLIKEGEYICYIPHCGNTINSLTNSNKNNFAIISNTLFAKQTNEEFIEIDRKEYNRISKLLSMLRENYNMIFDKNVSEARYFLAPKYLDNFNDTYLEEIKKAQYRSYNNELYFFGSEVFTAKEGIEFVIGSNNYKEYNLYYRLDELNNEDLTFVFFNFHQLYNQDKQNKLAQNLKKIKKHNHKIIQGDNLELISYFEKFYKVFIPNDEEIKNKISGIFVSFLVNRKKYKGIHWTLYPFVKHKLLNNLLEKYNSPEAIALALENFTEISKNDLLENISFWYQFQYEHSKAFEKINKNKVHAPVNIKEKWIFEITKNKFRVLYSEKDTGPLKLTKFITYLLLLIKYQEIHNKPFYVDIFRKAIFKYNGEKIPDIIVIETARIAVSKIFNEAIKEHDWFSVFYKTYIRYENYQYNIDLSKLDLIIIGFELKSNFFDKLH